MNRVMHVDFDAFFALVEQARNPALQGRPVAVGNGVIASCSYEARARGLYNGMPLSRASRERIRRETGLSVTVGIGRSRMIAKMAGKSALFDRRRFTPYALRPTMNLSSPLPRTRG